MIVMIQALYKVSKTNFTKALGCSLKKSDEVAGSTVYLLHDARTPSCAHAALRIHALIPAVRIQAYKLQILLHLHVHACMHSIRSGSPHDVLNACTLVDCMHVVHTCIFVDCMLCIHTVHACCARLWPAYYSTQDTPTQKLHYFVLG